MHFYVVMSIQRWEDIELAHNLPLPPAQMAGSPIPGCCGWLAVFDTLASAEAFAGGLPICPVKVKGEAPDPQGDITQCPVGSRRGWDEQRAGSAPEAREKPL